MNDVYVVQMCKREGVCVCACSHLKLSASPTRFISFLLDPACVLRQNETD